MSQNEILMNVVIMIYGEHKALFPLQGHHIKVKYSILR